MGVSFLEGFLRLPKIDCRHGIAANSLLDRLGAKTLEVQVVMGGAIHVVPDESFDDWVVCADVGDELGHYPTREAAELAAQAMAQDQGAELVVHLPDGKTIRRNFAKGWAARLFSR
jgi:hypothetical protein